MGQLWECDLCMARIEHYAAGYSVYHEPHNHGIVSTEPGETPDCYAPSKIFCSPVCLGAWASMAEVAS